MVGELIEKLISGKVRGQSKRSRTRPGPEQQIRTWDDIRMAEFEPESKVLALYAVVGEDIDEVAVIKDVEVFAVTDILPDEQVSYDASPDPFLPGMIYETKVPFKVAYSPVRKVAKTYRNNWPSL